MIENHPIARSRRRGRSGSPARAIPRASLIGTEGTKSFEMGWPEGIFHLLKKRIYGD
jgi:hypothetical protein